MSSKQAIVEIAQSLGFERTVIGSIEPMDAERKQYERWLEQGYAAGMEYLKRNPHFRTSPQLLYPNSRSAIIVSVSYFTQPPPDPGPRFGRVARYAVGLDYHPVIRARLRELKSRIEEKLGRPLIAKAFTDDVALYEQGYAARHGLGFSGKNTMIIGPKLSGSYYFIAELFTDLDLDADEPYIGTCGSCFRCGDACPTDAITSAGEVDANLCISYLTIENKGEIPFRLRSKIGRWVFGCDICQEVCPYNQRPPESPWREFQPSSGSGHYIDLCELISIENDIEFKLRFGDSSPLRRPRRFGLLRNALVVLGNSLSRSELQDAVVDRLHIIESLQSFVSREENPVLIEHAIWALAQSADSTLISGAMLDRVVDPAIRDKFSEYII
ncbi:MAG: tRNA epoxyqueuosine(34) reductase QueG [Cyanobacteria bacterium SZAS-4]|nr:tRNA epoxyqueuosine(34) reductase QueG [Cyanobacteria bacterium SZAS-4]